MKTRIVYPKLWFDEKFSQTSCQAKTLFFYLITCNNNGLTRYLHITDRQIQFDTGLDDDELILAKKNLEDIKWVFFTTNWAFHAHFGAYVDYLGRDRVMEAKEKELNDIPKDILEYFNQLITSYKPILNHKPETINPKPETLKHKSIEDSELDLDEIDKGINENRKESC